MKKAIATLTLATALAASAGVQAFGQSNEQVRKDAETQTKLDKKASKEQAKADKKANKALKSDKVKDAARQQDKADSAAARANSN